MTSYNKKPHACHKFQSRFGWEVGKYDLTWRLDKNNSVYLGWVSILSDEVRRSFLSVLQFYAVNFSASHACNICQRAKWFFEFTGGSLDAKLLVAYRSSLGSSKEHYLGGLKGFFCHLV